MMDVAKAFDKVPHKRLLSKLNYYGIIDGVQSEKKSRNIWCFLRNTFGLYSVPCVYK